MVEASVLANDDGLDGRQARSEVRTAGDLAAPDLVDVETVAVLRRRWLAGTISDERSAEAIGDLEAVELEHDPTLPLVRRGCGLRANVTAYDATYVELAEVLGCELLTADARLARAPGARCPVRLLQWLEWRGTQPAVEGARRQGERYGQTGRSPSTNGRSE